MYLIQVNKMSDSIPNKLRNPSEDAVNPEINNQRFACCFKTEDFGGGTHCAKFTREVCGNMGGVIYGDNCPRDIIDCIRLLYDRGTKNKTAIEMAAAVIKELKANKMSGSIENKLRNLSRAVDRPVPTPFEAGESIDEAMMSKKPGGPNPNTGKDCLIGIAPSWIFMIYDMLIYTMYGRSVGDPINGSIEGPGQVTTRDEPEQWMRVHQDFNPADPNTWGSVFGPGGEAERLINFFHCKTESGQGESLCTPAEVAAWIDMLRQLYTRRCGFAVAESGACCAPEDFGGFNCTQANSAAECSGVFYPGQTCDDIGGNNCGVAPNPVMIKSQKIAAKEIASAIIRKLKNRK